MKRATRGQKPDWFERPANVVGLNVCRMSGKLPSGGCDSVLVVNRDGINENRSMVYTEYFVRGTQPDTECLAAWRAFVRRTSRGHFRQGGRDARLGRCRGTAADREHDGRAGQSERDGP